MELPTSATLPPPTAASTLPPLATLPPTATTIAPGSVVEAPSSSGARSGYKTVPWNSLPIAEILPGKPEPKTYESTGKDDFGNEVKETGTYYDIPILYCPGGNPDLAKPEHFYVEGPPMMSYGGITSRLLGGKMAYSLKVSFRSPGGSSPDDEPTYDEQAKAFKRWFTELWRRTGQFIAMYKTQVKLPDFSADTDKELRMCGYKNKVFTPTDDFSQAPLEEKSTMYVKLLNWESTKDGSTDRTKFIGLDGELIDWNVLQRNIVMAVVPNFYVKKIYVSAKPSMQILLKSVVVLWAKPIEQRLPQLDTVMRLKAAFPEMANSLKAQLSALEEAGEEPRTEERTDSPAGKSSYTAGAMTSIGTKTIVPPVAEDNPI